MTKVRQTPEGQAIVAWHEVPGKRPPKEPSRRVRYDRAQLIPKVFLVESASRRTTPIVARHEMPDDVRVAVQREGPFPKTWISSVLTSETWSLQYFNHRIEVRTPWQESDRTLRDGSLGVAMSQALRARLRSHCPSGTKAIRQSGVSR